MKGLDVGVIVHYVMEGRDGNHVAGIVSYVDPDRDGNINLCIPSGSKVGKGFIPTPLPRTDVPFDASGEVPMTWHFREGAK